MTTTGPRAVWILVGLLTAAALAVRLIGAGAPPHYLYDEAYYVAAAQNLLGLPMAHGGMFPHAARFTDPNAGSAPPLGKVILAGAIAAFGNAPWVWRFPGAIAGASLPLTTAWVARTWWPDRPQIAVIAAALVTGSALGIGLSRVALLDSTAIPVLWAGIACWSAGLSRVRWPLLLAGAVLLGAGLAIKWTGVQALGDTGLVTLGVGWAQRWPVRRWFGVGALLISGPLATYAATYRFLWPASAGFLGRVAQQQVRMVHTLWALRFHNTALAPPWSWWVGGHPLILVAQRLPQGVTHSLLLINVAVTLAGACALLGGGLWAFRARRDRGAWCFLAAGTLAFWATWLLTPRSTFGYYFYPMVPVLALALGAGLAACAPRWRWGLGGLLALSCLAYLPFVVGVPL
jgi:dolichyl-phosphate-mannose-protein mannosyltransferase